MGSSSFVNLHQCKCRGKGYFDTARALKDHCFSMEDWFHRLLGLYLVKMYERSFNKLISSDSGTVENDDVTTSRSQDIEHQPSTKYYATG